MPIELARLLEIRRVRCLLSYDGALAKAKLRAERGPQGPNPFVIGTAAVERSLHVVCACGRAQRDRFLMM
jgi:hypothetical protein